jgi:hypothetical protein
MTIKLENFIATIDVETLVVTNVNDNINSKVANVTVLINGKFSTTLTGFKYVDSWEDSEVLDWANLEIEKFKV